MLKNISRFLKKICQTLYIYKYFIVQKNKKINENSDDDDIKKLHDLQFHEDCKKRLDG